MNHACDSKASDLGVEEPDQEIDGAIEEFLFNLYCSPSAERIMAIQDSLLAHSPGDVDNFFRELRGLKSQFASFVSGPPPRMDDSDRSQAMQDLNDLLVGWELSAAAMARPGWSERIHAMAAEVLRA